MTANKNVIPQRSWPRWRVVLLGLNMLAIVLSTILSWHYLQNGTMAGCGTGSSCDQVLNSRWSEIAGILPVSGLALGLYLALLVAGFFIGPTTENAVRNLAWRVMLIIAGAIAGSAIWFTILQKWIIGAFCPYCMGLHGTGLILSILIISRSFSKIIRPLQATGFLIIGLILAGLLAAFQSGFRPSTAYSNGDSQENFYAIDYHNAPVLGSADAPYKVNVLFDYQCSHCQKIHFMLNEAVNRYNGQLAFALCPVPLNSECNPYIPQNNDAFKNSCELAKIGLTVWIAKREIFADFENWMFTFESGDRWNPRSLSSAKEKAIELLGRESFDSGYSDPWIEKYMESCIIIYGQTLQSGKGGVPKLIYGSRWIIPEVYNTNDFVKMLQESLDVPLP